MHMSRLFNCRRLTSAIRVTAAAAALVLMSQSVSAQIPNPFAVPDVDDPVSEVEEVVEFSPLVEEQLSRAELLERHHESVLRELRRNSVLVGTVKDNTRVYLEPNAGCYLHITNNLIDPSLCKEVVMDYVHVSQSGSVTYPSLTDDPKPSGSTPLTTGSQRPAFIGDVSRHLYIPMSCGAQYERHLELLHAGDGSAIPFASESEARQRGFRRLNVSDC